ncbi:hypothetical protein BC941DRAFT_453544 [Chlamydoabsidia padenii]|nr:hypothetical protein BC941DRAFT_453544 [Chlamydoabsidia padenii]
METVDTTTTEGIGDSRLKQLLYQADLLVGTSQQQRQQNPTEDLSLEQQLSQRLQELNLGKHSLGNGKDLTIRATFVQECLQLLVAIQDALTDEITTAEGNEKGHKLIVIILVFVIYAWCTLYFKL